MNSNVSIVGIRDFLERSGKLLVANPILFLPAVFYVLLSVAFNAAVFGEYVPTDVHFLKMIKSIGWVDYALFGWITDLPPTILLSIAMGVTIKMAKVITEGREDARDMGLRTLESSWPALAIVGLLFNFFMISILLVFLLPMVLLAGTVPLPGTPLLPWLLLWVALLAGLWKIGWNNAMSLIVFAIPVLVFEELGVTEAIKRGARIWGMMWGQMKEYSSRKDSTALFMSFAVAWMLVNLLEDIIQDHAATWIYLVTKPVFLAYGWVIWAVFFILVWQKFGDGEGS